MKMFTAKGLNGAKLVTRKACTEVTHEGARYPFRRAVQRERSRSNTPITGVIFHQRVHGQQILRSMGKRNDFESCSKLSRRGNMENL